jgi:ABC-type glycerol-3-phosphate transport system substrate-binding protein
MKFNFLMFIVLMVVAAACGNKETSESDDVEWKEMDEFHEVMADMYHPLKDSNNLEPIKKNVANFSAAATKWAQAKVPAKVDNGEIKDLLAQLEDGSQALKKMIDEGSPDEEIASKLTGLHDIFHTIMEKWYSAGKEDGAEEHHDH